MAAFASLSSLSLLASSLLLTNLVTTLPVSCAAQQQSHSRNVNWRSVPSLLESLLYRVANHRVAKGDLQGADRVRSILKYVATGFQFWRIAGSMGWDYLIHYSWKHWRPSDMLEVVRLMSELQSFVREVMQLRSHSERLLWVSANFDRVQQIAKLTFQKLLEFFNRSGALRDCILAVQREFIKGGLIRDALELGDADLQGLIQIAKDVIQNYLGSFPSSANSDL